MTITDIPAPTDISALDSIAALAAEAAPAYADTAPSARAASLIAVADKLTDFTDELVAIAREETGLTEARLQGELKRTSVQLKLFAETVRDGSYLDARLDEADPGFALGPRPDIRRVLAPLGPVLNFAASNFPFAFSVAGGDSAAALAAGCPVIVKSHSGHPRLSYRTADLVKEALRETGMPDGTFQLVSGQKAGVELLKDDRIRAGSFTGSLHVGRMLADVAAARPRPIPFFGELGSVNPVFVTAAAAASRGEEIGSGFYTSISGSAGQLCTKPGFVFVPAIHDIAPAVIAAGTDVAEQRLLNPNIARGFGERRTAILGTENLDVVLEGSFRVDEDGQGWARPTVVAVSLDEFRRQRDVLLEEAFGPLSVFVIYPSGTDLGALAREFFPGNLTGSLQHGIDEQSNELKSLVAALAETSGRVVFNGWPTGVAVTPAMQHGGPWPATTSDGTSVGSAAIGRFLRGISYQNAPQVLLPPPLRDENSWGVPRSYSKAGESNHWGSA
ncbi:aldehyde dehydrogenase (NADP(+)) [Paenarthrobacter nicotinovorans]|uniref:aldehyde dehydrogenase (NADP(+)) n=1 Tax=Paenarthrobacter nicotinovorans TaxID=29320 RepID=UPI0037489601